MMRCYLLGVCSGSSLDQHSNNISLFGLIEQINVPPGAPPPPRGVIPVEIHAYFRLQPEDIGRGFEVRFAMVASTGLETMSDAFHHKCSTPRYRTKTLGLPFPPVTGAYELRVDLRSEGSLSWQRDPVSWPITILEAESKPRVTH